MNPTDPVELAKSAGMKFFRAGHSLAAAIVYGEAAVRAPDDPAVLLGFGAGVGNSAGRLVIAPFVQWSTKLLERCITTGDSEYTKVARERLDELKTKPEYLPLAPAQQSEFEPLLAFLDVDPRNTLPAAIDDLPEDDKMFAIMALGDLGSPRFWAAIAGAIDGRWGAGAARSALKRVGRYARYIAVRNAMVRLKSGLLADECEPYRKFALESVVSVQATIKAPTGFVRVEPPPVTPVAAPNGKKPWWKFW